MRGGINLKDVRLRFAPSPTGYLHIGSLRTALYNYLYAKKHNGKYILRIEDTDQTRLVGDATEKLIEALEWAGIHHDEGVYIEDGKIVERGDYGPYIQSERLDIYRPYVDQLIESDHAYHCFCSKERIDRIREEQKIKGLIPRYDGFCRTLSKEEVQKKLDAGEEYVVRLKFPKDTDIVFEDEVRGTITMNTNDQDDQVLLKSDGFPTYHMAVVVDDHLMGITHIVRGEEWLSSVPKHVFLYNAFGWEIPTFVHLPTVLNNERKKLSKRHGDVSVEDFKAKGYLPEGLVNYLALVGWAPDSNKEIFSMDELIDEFSFDRVAKTGGIFDVAKLDWVNEHHIREYDNDKLVDLAIPYLKEANLIDDNTDREWIKSIVIALKENISKMSDIVEKAEMFFGNDIEPENDEAKEMLKGEQVPELIKAFRKELDNIDEVDEEFASTIMKKIQSETGIKGKNLFMPTRILISGTMHGPDLGSIINILGKKNILERLDKMEKNYIE